ncbi:MAG TPA: entericidin A/B family lipoprotein [Phycisphaerales bacterium]|nr:entericidin A/B family lipoprotein [Phycisphaerales bacterium]
MTTRSVVRAVPALLAAGVLGIAACVLSACNTVKGAGEDIKAVGQAGEDVLTGNKSNNKD